MGRLPYHLALRDDDPFEAMIFKCIKTLPHGMGKLFWKRAAKLIIGDTRDPLTVSRIMFEFAAEVNPDIVIQQPVIENVANITKEAAAERYPKSVNRQIQRPFVDRWTTRRANKAKQYGLDNAYIEDPPEPKRKRGRPRKVREEEAKPAPITEPQQVLPLAGGMFS